MEIWETGRADPANQSQLPEVYWLDKQAKRGSRGASLYQQSRELRSWEGGHDTIYSHGLAIHGLVENRSSVS
jgi:hypothetical protein